MVEDTSEQKYKDVEEENKESKSVSWFNRVPALWKAAAVGIVLIKYIQIN